MTHPPHRILVVNPGGLSTKVALFVGDNETAAANLEHSPAELKAFHGIVDQLPLRLAAVEDFLTQHRIDPASLSAIAARGGPFPPLRSGVYGVNEAMLKDIRDGNMQLPHASSLGPLIADELSRRHGVPSFMVDPVSVDEMAPWARLSGLKELPRRGLSHALNTKYVARKVCRMLGVAYEDIRMVVAHLGSGISVTAHIEGRMTDVSDAMNGGPFSTQRTGALPVVDLVDMCFSGTYSKDQIKRMIMREGGAYSYIGTASGKELEARATSGDAEAALALEAMAYQIAKEIGAMSAAAGSPLKVIVLTGGLARSQVVTRKIVDRVKFMAPVEVLPGEFESEALAEGARRVLDGETEALVYPAPPLESMMI